MNVASEIASELNPERRDQLFADALQILEKWRTVEDRGVNVVNNHVEKLLLGFRGFKHQPGGCLTRSHDQVAVSSRVASPVMGEPGRRQGCVESLKKLTPGSNARGLGESLALGFIHFPLSPRVHQRNDRSRKCAQGHPGQRQQAGRCRCIEPHAPILAHIGGAA